MMHKHKGKKTYHFNLKVAWKIRKHQKDQDDIFLILKDDLSSDF